MTELKKILINHNVSGYSYEEAIIGAVESVGRENSTHLNADRCGREEIEQRLISFGRDELLLCLREPEHDDLKLVKEIARITSAERNARTNVSFASKICHYACFYLFEGTEYQDN